MPLVTYSLTGDITDVIGTAFPLGSAYVALESSQPLVVDTGAGGIRVAATTQVDVATDGSVSVTGIPATTGGAPLYRLRIEARSGNAPATTTITGWFELTADRTLEWVVNNSVAPIMVTPTIVADVTAQAVRAEAAAARAEATTGAWTQNTFYNLGDTVELEDGSTVWRNTSGTSRTGFDATEEAEWTAVEVVTGTIVQKALAAAYTPTASTARHPLTGFYHTSGFGAVGDWNGTTGTDNLAAFNAAVAQLNTDGGEGVIYIDRPGSYHLSNGWMVTGDDVTVICHPDAEVLTTAATVGLGATVTFMGGGGIQTPSNAVDTPQSTRAEWVGGRVSASGSGTSDNALGFVRYKNVHAADVRLDADRKALTAQYGVENVVWERVVVESGDVSAFTVETSCHNVTIRDFDIIATLGNGFHIMSVDAGTRRNTDVRIGPGRVRSAGGWGILAGATDGLTVSRVTIDSATSGNASYTDCTDVRTDLPGTFTTSGTSWATTRWVNLTLQNSWVTQGAGYPTPGVLREPHGRIGLRGNIKSGTATAGTILTTLPAGYRPANNRTYAVDSIDNTGAIVAARILVNSSGEVILQKGGNNFALSLDQVSFYAA